MRLLPLLCLLACNKEPSLPSAADRARVCVHISNVVVDELELPAEKQAPARLDAQSMCEKQLTETSASLEAQPDSEETKALRRTWIKKMAAYESAKNNAQITCLDKVKFEKDLAGCERL